MLKVYRRHNPARCSHKARTWRRCSCILWADGTLSGKRYHKTLKTRNWDDAQKKAQKLEADGQETSRQTISSICDAFLHDAEARGLRDSSLYKYELLFRRLKAFAEQEGLRYAAELNIDVLRRFRATWKLKNFAARVTTENLRALMRFAHDSGWIQTNPGKLLKSPEVTGNPVVPFTDDEMQRIVKACDSYKTIGNGVYIKAFVLLLRYSGLRIRDAVSLERSKLTDDKLLLFTAKTGTPVNLPLPPECINALTAIPSNGTGYFFWSGQGKIKVRVGNYQACLQKLFKSADVTGGTAHRFRHSFAVNLLIKSVPIERVAVLLGHSSTKVTQRHYSPWIAARQEQLEADVRRTWIEPTTFATIQKDSHNSK